MGHSQLVLLRKFLHTQDDNDVLEWSVVLWDLLNPMGNIIILISNNTGIHDLRSGIQRIHSWVDAQLSNSMDQHSGSIQMGKGSGRGRVSQVISRHIDCLKWVKNPWKAAESQVIWFKPPPISDLSSSTHPILAFKSPPQKSLLTIPNTYWVSL